MKHKCFIPRFRRPRRSGLTLLCPESRALREEFAIFLKKRLVHSWASYIFRQVEGVRLKIQNEIGNNIPLRVSCGQKQLENMSELVQDLYIDMQTTLRRKRKLLDKQRFTKNCEGAISPE